MILTFDEEGFKLLTPEQLKVVERWNREVEERLKIIPALTSAYNSGDKEEARKLTNKLLEIDAARCEHGRDKYGTCIGCSEIEDLLWPRSSEDE